MVEDLAGSDRIPPVSRIPHSGEGLGLLGHFVFADWASPF